MKLAASKATTEAVLSFALIAFLAGISLFEDTYQLLDVTGKDNFLSFLVSTGREITTFFSTFTSGILDGSISTSVLLPAFGSVLWTGVYFRYCIQKEYYFLWSLIILTTVVQTFLYSRLDHLCLYHMGSKFRSVKS